MGNVINIINIPFIEFLNSTVVFPTSLALLVVSGHPVFGGILSATFRAKAPLMEIWAKTFWEPLQPNTDPSPFPPRGAGLSYRGIPTLHLMPLPFSH